MTTRARLNLIATIALLVAVTNVSSLHAQETCAEKLLSIGPCGIYEVAFDSEDDRFQPYINRELVFYSLCRPENRDVIAAQMMVLTPGIFRIRRVETDCEEGERGYFVFSTERQNLTEPASDSIPIDKILPNTNFGQ